MSKSDKAISSMTRAKLEFTQKIQLHFPDISDDILSAWNGVKVDFLTNKLDEIFGKMPEIPKEIPVSKFYLIAEFEITVPMDYEPKKYLAQFAKKYRKDFVGYNDNITNQKEYSNPTYPLIPGKKYRVKIWGINKGMIATYLECLQLLSDNNVLLTGAPGAALVYQQAKDMLPKGKWTFSYDEKDKLWEDANGNHRVPNIYRDSDGDYRFNLNLFESDRNDFDCLLAFGDCEPLAS
jgi:hypothetical protein